MTNRAAQILERARQLEIRIVTAESCTGGMIAAALTDIAGSSDVFERGFVTYSNEAKQELLGVRAASLSAFGAVSQQVAGEMAEGALAHAHAEMALSVTGIAGPGGGTAEKPVGLVWFGLAVKGKPLHTVRQQFAGPDRAAIRAAATEFGLELLWRALGDQAAPGAP